MRTSLASSRIESLESRIAPASLVTVTFIKGALSLTGDTGAHDFSITAFDTSTTQLKAAPGTLFHMEGIADTDTLLLTGSLKSLTATLGDADDHLSLTGLNIAGNVTINGGLGTNATEIDTLAVKGALKITGGANADTIEVAGGTFSVKKDFTLELGDGTNALTNAAHFQVGKNFTYTGGIGADAFTAEQGNTSIGGNFSFTPGAGAATFGIINPLTPGSFTVGKKLTFDSSGSLAGDAVQISLGTYSTRIGGDIEITDGAGNLSFSTTAVATSGFHGNVHVETGAGTSNISFVLYSFVAKSISIDASASTSSTVTLGGFAASIASSVHYTGSDGPDSLSIASYGSLGSSLGSSLVADLGNGSNDLRAVSLGGFFKSVKVTSGSGDDEILLAALNAKTSKIDIQTGGGTDETQIALLNSSISGTVSVANAPDAVKGTVALAFLNSKIGSLDISLAGDGNEVIFGAVDAVATASSGLTVKKTLHISGGAGADTIDFLGAADLKVGGIDLDLGDGMNQVTCDVSNLAAKSFSVTGGSGVDIVNVTPSGSVGAVSLTLGSGVNSATIEGGVSPLAVKSLTYSSTSESADADSLTLARLIVAGKVNAQFGAGSSRLLLDDIVVNGPLGIETGAGVDAVRIDTADSYGGTVLAKAVTVNLGADDDVLELGGNGSSALLTAKSTFTADGGTGSNTLTNGIGNIFAKTPTFTAFPA